jgi:nucleoside-diphosphate-sugar epimerase
VRKFAILGAGGFIGYRLTEYLLLNNLATPRPVVRNFTSMARLSKFDLDIGVADAVDASALTQVITGCETVFHCVVGNRKTILDSLKATYLACRRAGVGRLVYLSSAVVHGQNIRPGSEEESPLIKKQPFEYNVSKVRAEELLRSMASDGAVACVVLRPSIVFGPRSTQWTAGIAHHLLTGKAYLVDGGNGICNTVFIDNLVEVMALCAIHPRAKGHTFLVKDAERVTWRQFYAAIAEALSVDLRCVPSVTIDTSSGVPPRSEKLQRAARWMWDSRLGRAAKELMRSPETRTKLRSWVQGELVARDASAGRIVVDPRLVELQKCQYELPSQRLADVLDYRPSIGFDEACRRTAEWLRFALGTT